MDFRRSNNTSNQHYAQPAGQPVHHKKRGVGGMKMPSGASLAMWIIGLIILAAAIGTAAYYVSRYNDQKEKVADLSDQIKNPDKTAKAEQQALVAQVGQLTELPKNETPTVATVTDVTKLKDQAFFVNAQNGDKVLIYTKAKKAYLYRPSTKKIINIAPVNIGSSQKSSTTNTNTNSTTQP